MLVTEQQVCHDEEGKAVKKEIIVALLTKAMPCVLIYLSHIVMIPELLFCICRHTY